MENYRNQAIASGMDDYLTKPFNLEELLLRVAKLIQKTNTAKQLLVVDEYSSYMWAFGIRKKSEVMKVLKDLIVRLENFLNFLK